MPRSNSIDPSEVWDSRSGRSSPVDKVYSRPGSPTPSVVSRSSSKSRTSRGSSSFKDTVPRSTNTTSYFNDARTRPNRIEMMEKSHLGPGCYEVDDLYRPKSPVLYKEKTVFSLIKNDAPGYVPPVGTYNIASTFSSKRGTNKSAVFRSSGRQKELLGNSNKPCFNYYTLRDDINKSHLGPNTYQLRPSSRGCLLVSPSFSDARFRDAIFQSSSVLIADIEAENRPLSSHSRHGSSSPSQEKPWRNDAGTKVKKVNFVLRETPQDRIQDIRIVAELPEY